MKEGSVKKAMLAGLLLLIASIFMSPGRAQVISTVAGGGLGDGALAVLSSMFQPRAIAADASGNLYVIDSSQRVRRIDARTGIITHFAGGGGVVPGDGGPAATAGLNAIDVAVDRQGNVLISDTFTASVRRVDARTGIVTKVASLPDPSRLAIDGNGNVFVGQGGFFPTTVRKVAAATGTVTTVASGLGSIRGLAVDSKGNLFVSEDDRIKRIDASTGATSTIASGFIFGAGLAIDGDDNLYLADSSAHRVHMIDASSGNLRTVAGTGPDKRNCTFLCIGGYFAGDGGRAQDAGLNGPAAVAADARGNLYIADTENYRIRRVDGNTDVITTVAGPGFTSVGDGGIATSALLGLTEALVVAPNGDLYVAANAVVRKVSASTGLITTVAGSGNPNRSGDGGPATQAGMFPRMLALDPAGDLYIADGGRVRRVSAATGLISTVAGDDEIGDAWGIAFDRSGNLYYVQSARNRIRKVAAGSGAVTTIAGNGTAASTGDGGPATSASLNQPTALASDGSNLYVMDWRGASVRKIDLASGIITTAASGLNADIRAGIALDASGNLYVGEYAAVRKVAAATGTMTPVAGGNTRGFGGDGGPALSASLDTATGVGLDSRGNLYFNDMMSGRVRKVSAVADNHQGLWWKSPGGSESGWGVNLTHQGDTVFATWFTYDADGNGLWLVMPSGVRMYGALSGNTYAGALYRTTGPAFDASPWNPSSVTVTLVGSARFNFASADSGVLAYTVNGSTQVKTIMREVFAQGAPTCIAGGAAPATPNYQDLWWRSGGSESGWGVNIAHQGDTLFATWFTYDKAGKGQWLVMSNGMRTGPGRYGGALYRTRGPAFDAEPWLPSQVTAQQVGTASFLFDDASNGTFSYVVDGVSQSKPITRQVFSSPSTVCQ